MKMLRIPDHLSDDQALATLHELSRRSNRAEAALVAVLAVVDDRRLFLRHACSSMFVYCTEVLHYAEHVAYHRIGVARAARKHPVILEMLADGRLHLTAVALLKPHLTADNAGELLDRAVHKTKRQIQKMLAEIAPKPDVPRILRKLPTRKRVTGPAPVAAAPAPATPPAPAPASAASAARLPRPVLEPLAPARYRVQFTASQDFHDKLTRLRGLLRSQVPDGDFAAILEIAVTEKLARVEARKFGKTDRPRKSVADVKDADEAKRPIPLPVKRAVFDRDGGRCTYVHPATGRRCSATEDLEFHHIVPWELCRKHELDNICLHCRPHNQYQAELAFGVEHMAQFRGKRAEESRARYVAHGHVMAGPAARRRPRQPERAMRGAQEGAAARGGRGGTRSRAARSSAGTSNHERARTRSWTGQTTQLLRRASSLAPLHLPPRSRATAPAQGEGMASPAHARPQAGTIYIRRPMVSTSRRSPSRNAPPGWRPSIAKPCFS